MIRRINFLFWFFWLTSSTIYLTEAFTYMGFIEKHLKIIPVWLVYATVFFGMATILFKFTKKNIESDKYEKKILVYSCTIIFLYIFFKIANRLTYPNFVFSTIHVQPQNLVTPIILSLVPIVITWLPRIYFKKLLNTTSFLLVASIFLILFNFYKIYKTEYWAFQFIINHPNATYGDKMSRAVGSLFYNFTQFINKYSPDNSNLLIPPQAFPWPQSGNGAFLRYFVYPRTLGNGREFSLPEGTNIRDYDYVLLAWGETESTEGVYTHGWPKFDIVAEKIIIMNEDGSWGGERVGDYHYLDYAGQNVWGLIKVKK